MGKIKILRGGKETTGRMNLTTAEEGIGMAGIKDKGGSHPRDNLPSETLTAGRHPIDRDNDEQTLPP